MKKVEYLPYKDKWNVKHFKKFKVPMHICVVPINNRFTNLCMQNLMEKIKVHKYT